MHSSETHLFICAEACVDRAWSTKVNDLDDEIVELTVTFKPPNFAVINSLFPGHHVEFGWEEDKPELYRFSLMIRRKVSRKRPESSYSPSQETPLWYGFLYEFEEVLTDTTAVNSDFSGLLIKGELSPDRPNPMPQQQPTKIRKLAPKLMPPVALPSEPDPLPRTRFQARVQKQLVEKTTTNTNNNISNVDEESERDEH
jgi:hypothetical protein